MHSPVFDDTSKWAFKFNDNKIRASINDEDFNESERVNGKFGKGDKLLVSLEVTSKYDRELKTHVPKNYKILKVYQHLSREGTGTLNFKDKE